MVSYDNFWLAAAAAAPVIALANQVTLTDSLGMLGIFNAAQAETSGTAHAAARRGSINARFAYVIGYSNLVLQVLILGFALSSLGDIKGTHRLSPLVAQVALILGLLSVGATSTYVARLRLAKTVLDAERAKPAQDQ